MQDDRDIPMIDIPKNSIPGDSQSKRQNCLTSFDRFVPTDSIDIPIIYSNDIPMISTRTGRWNESCHVLVDI